MSKKSPNDLFAIIDSLNHTKVHLFNEGYPESVYKPFIVNKTLSNFSDTIMHANEMNRRYHIPVKYQYEYLFNCIRKRKRFAKWLKKEKDEELAPIMEYYGISYRKAKEYVKLLTKEQIQKIAKETQKGGVD